MEPTRHELLPLTTVTLTLHDKPAITSLPHVLDLISTFLDCSADIPLHQACALGSLSLLDRIWTQSLLPLDKCRRWCPAASLQTNRHYKRWQFSQSLLQAVRRRDLSIVEWLFSHFTHCVSDVGVVEEAASTGQLEILKFLLENDREYTQDEYEFAHTAATSGSEEVLIEGNSVTWGSKDLQLAAKNGHHDVVRWLYEHTEGIDRKESRVVKYVVRTGGDFSLVQWLCSQGIEMEDSLEVADEAAAVGNLPMLQWMITEEFAVDFEENGPYEIQLPSDHLEVIKWLVDSELVCDAFGAFAATCGHSPLPVVWWLTEYIEANDVPIYRNADCTALKNAAAHGRLEVVKWLLEHNYGRKSTRAIRYAAANGHLEVAKFLHAEGFIGCDSRTMEEAAKAGHLEVVQWLWTEFGNDDEAKLLRFLGKQDSPFENWIRAAAGCGHLAVVQYLHKLALALTGKKRDQEEGHPSKIVMDSAVAEAARNGHHDVVQWLCTHAVVVSTERAMTNAAYSGHFSIVQWLHENRSERYSTIVMDAVSCGGNLAMLKWLRANRPSEGYSTLALSFFSQSTPNRLAVVRWLTAESPTSTYDHEQMSRAVMNSNFDLVLFWNSIGRSCNGINWEIGLEISAHILAWLGEELKVVPSENYHPESESDNDRSQAESDSDSD